jgi:hypothetical protein
MATKLVAGRASSPLRKFLYYTRFRDMLTICSGNSTIAEEINKAPAKSVADRFNELSPVGKIAVYASAGGVGLLAFVILTFCCIRNRRAGRREGEAYNQKFETERANALNYQMELKNNGATGYNPAPMSSPAFPSPARGVDNNQDGYYKPEYVQSEFSSPTANYGNQGGYFNGHSGQQSRF